MAILSNLLTNSTLQISSSVGGIIIMIALAMVARKSTRKLIRVAAVFIGAILFANIFGLQSEMLQLIQYTLSSIQYIVSIIFQIMTNNI